MCLWKYQLTRRLSGKTTKHCTTLQLFVCMAWPSNTWGGEAMEVCNGAVLVGIAGWWW